MAGPRLHRTLRGTPLTDEQWARLAPPLESYDAHASGSGDSNGLYLEQLYAKAAIPDPDALHDTGGSAG